MYINVQGLMAGLSSIATSRNLILDHKYSYLFLLNKLVCVDLVILCKYNPELFYLVVKNGVNIYIHIPNFAQNFFFDFDDINYFELEPET